MVYGGCVSRSFGRALGSHSRGQGFDSPYLHHEFWEYHFDTPSFLIASFVLYFWKDESEFREEIMQIDFNDINELTMLGMNNGTGQMTVRMYNDDKYRIIPTIIHAGGSIGLHTQNSGDDLNYIISGTGKAICDGVEEKLSAGVMHICPKGSEHTIINTGDDNLVMLTVVIAR